MTGSTLVLLYHRVAVVGCDPHGLAVHPERFARHCEVLRRYPVVPLSEAGRRPREVAITFDDGYADNAATAAVLLRGAGLPATFFITTGLIGGTVEAWWDRLAGLLLETPRAPAALDVDVEGRRLWLDARSAAARNRAHLALFWRLRPRPTPAIADALDRLAADLQLDPSTRDSHRWMDVDQLRALAAQPGVEIGAHTVTHPLLARLDAATQWAEIDGAATALQDLLGRRPHLFSYPHGSPDAFDAVTVGLTRDAGFSRACTAIGGLARPDGDPLRVPRRVVGDWEAEVFRERLERWLAAG